MQSNDSGSRNAERTRRIILDATIRALGVRGASMTVADVATEAGVSKGGVLHHFGTRDALLLAVTEDVLDRLRHEVLVRVDLSENHPGKLLRAYVNVVVGAEPDQRRMFNSTSIWSSVHNIPGVEEVIAQDSDRWTHDLLQDGLHPDRVQLARRAADGLAIAIDCEPDLQRADIEREVAVILALTEVNSEMPAGSNH